jgi:tight adherence protein B
MAAVLLVRPPQRWVIGIRLGMSWKPWRPVAVGPALGAGLIVGAVALALAMLSPATVFVAATAGGAALFGLRQTRAARVRRSSVRTRAETTMALELLAAELRAGTLPAYALAAVAEDAPSVRPAAAAARHGGDVAAALATAGASPGAGVLVDLAGAWQVAERAGAPLADVLDRVAAGVREDAEVDRDVQAEAAPARATGRLMAVLPLLGLSLGAGMGADPVHVLTGTLGGALCLTAGVALACAGIAWVDRIVASVASA